MVGVADRLGAYARLGSLSLLRVGIYRLGLRSGLHPVLKISDEVIEGPFFAAATNRSGEGLAPPQRWARTMPAFSAHEFALEGPPAWTASPFQPEIKLSADKPWYAISDFGSGVDDIKAVWEASRFDWVVSMAQRAALGDEEEGERLNQWLADWQLANPPYLGPNWKCGQEASIRVMHLAAAALVLREENHPLTGLQALIRQHCKRIAPTMGYAMGQDNNHGTSEAAALFIGGAWLAAHGDKQARSWLQSGRAALEERCASLIEDDGTFSQYSVTYHRVMLDTYCLAETWRQRLGLAPFSPGLRDRMKAATEWLRQLTDPDSGDAPNIGANDGALLIPLADTDYRDFRPTVQWAAKLFCNARAYRRSGPYDRQLAWLDLDPASNNLEPVGSSSFDAGGFHVLRAGKLVAYMRYPRFRFRPSQADALHVDLWADGKNMLRDGGTYSYAISDEDIAYFGGTESHNTAQFDGRDQMPRIGRFLFARWLKARNVERVAQSDSGIAAAAGYRDWKGACHDRRLELSEDRLICTDTLAGQASQAVLRWRLAPGVWRQEGSEVLGEAMNLSVASDDSGCQMRLTEGMESRYYRQKTALPVLEITCRLPCKIVTEFSFR